MYFLSRNSVNTERLVPHQEAEHIIRRMIVQLRSYQAVNAAAGKVKESLVEIVKAGSFQAIRLRLAYVFSQAPF